jgi:hypothetical protein
MTMTRRSAFAAMIGLALASGSIAYAEQPKNTAAAQASASAVASPKGPWIGKWKRNSAKSTMPSDGTTLFDMKLECDDGFRYTMTRTPTSGAASHAEAFGRFDGKPYPEQGNPAADFNVFKRIDDHSYSVVDLKDGKPTFNITVTVSADGKTRTSVSKGRNAQGEEVTNTGVWDRVE